MLSDHPHCVEQECYPNPCGLHGDCSYGSCTCHAGYIGATCDTCAAGYLDAISGTLNVSDGSWWNEMMVDAGECVDDPCAPDPCNGHGACSSPNLANGSWECTCQDKYQGATCDSCRMFDAESGFAGYPDCQVRRLSCLHPRTRPCSFLRACGCGGVRVWSSWALTAPVAGNRSGPMRAGPLPRPRQMPPWRQHPGAVRRQRLRRRNQLSLRQRLHLQGTLARPAGSELHRGMRLRLA